MNRYRDVFLLRHWLHKSYHLCIFTLKLEKTLFFLEKTRKKRVNLELCVPAVCNYQAIMCVMCLIKVYQCVQPKSVSISLLHREM